MPESESGALPLGDTPMLRQILLVGIDGFEPSEWRSQSPLPYLLAISHNLSQTIQFITAVLYSFYIISDISAKLQDRSL